MSNIKRQITMDYYGYHDEDTTARYHDEPDFCMEEPVGDLFDDDTYWMDGDEEE